MKLTVTFKAKVLRAGAGLVLVLVGYLLFWPVPIEPRAWTPPPAPRWEGLYARNERLKDVQRIANGVDYGPEDVAMDSRGRIYAGVDAGRIVRFSPDGRWYETFAETGGRPLGLDFDPKGNLMVADSERGLLAVSPEGEVSVLATEEGGLPFGLTDDVDVGSDGTVYFSDASWKFSQQDYMLDILEHGANGRLLAYEPSRRETRRLMGDLHFANGVAVSPDLSFVLVCETTRYRILRYWLTGGKQGESDVFIDNLPGFPDGVSSNGRDTFWVAIVSPRDATLDALLPWPSIRKVALRLPWLLPEPRRYGLVLGLDAEGRVVRNLQDPTATAYDSITSVEEHGGLLYLGSVGQDGIGRLPVPRNP